MAKGHFLDDAAAGRRPNLGLRQVRVGIGKDFASNRLYWEERKQVPLVDMCVCGFCYGQSDCKCRASENAPGMHGCGRGVSSLLESNVNPRH